MKKYKAFTCSLAIVLAAYCLFNFAVWHLYTKKLVADPACAGGDLTRMGYIADSKACRQNVYDLPRRHVERDDYRGGVVDVVTFGDSFSNGGAGGRNPYYQDYLATLSDVSVLN